MLDIQAGIAYQNLAQTLNAIYLMLQEVVPKTKSPRYDVDDYFNDIRILAYASRVGVFEILENYNWHPEGIIFIDAIDSNGIPLTDALQQTVGKVIQLGNELGLERWVTGIIEKNELFYQFESTIPEEVRKNMFN